MLNATASVPAPDFTAIVSRSRRRVWPFFLALLAAAAGLVAALAG
ncbi:MAG TPA: hypothetical protein VLJ18_02370 [Thermoanaerobaculia bacterium]|nr:hypothetical protein [Thermoanaerobaculia bacterium]